MRVQWTDSSKDKLPNLTQEETENLNRPITIKGIELLVKNLPAKKSLDEKGFAGEFYSMFNKGIIPIIRKLFQKAEEEEHFPTHFIMSVLS